MPVELIFILILCHRVRIIFFYTTLMLSYMMLSAGMLQKYHLEYTSENSPYKSIEWLIHRITRIQIRFQSLLPTL